MQESLFSIVSKTQNAKKNCLQAAGLKNMFILVYDQYEIQK